MVDNQGIYRITSPSGRIYIGQSIDIERRFKHYVDLRCKSQTRLYSSFMKYGVGGHVFEVLEVCNEESMNERERFYQDLYDVMGKNGLNCLLTTTNDRSGKLSIETKAKLSRAAIKQKRMKCSDGTKRKISVANKGKKRSAEYLEYLSASRTGFRHTEATKKKMSIIHRGKKRTQEQKDRMSLASTRAIKTICIVGSKTFNSISEAARFLGIRPNYLSRQLRGDRINNTSIRYAYGD